MVDRVVDAILPVLRDGEQASVMILDHGEVDAGPIFQMLIVFDRLGIPKRLAGRVDLFDVFDHFLEERGVLGGMVYGTQKLFGLLPVSEKRVASLILLTRPLYPTQIGDDVFDVELHGVAKVEANRVDQDVDGGARHFGIDQKQSGAFEISPGVIVEIVRAAVVADARVEA